MRRIVLLVGFVAGVAGSWFVPAHATPNEIRETDSIEAHVVGIPVGLGPSQTYTDCGNAWRAIVCNAVAAHSPQTIGVSVNTGNPNTGASFTMTIFTD